MDKSPPASARIRVESDSVIRLEANFADPESCLLALKLLFLEIKQRHGPAAGRAAAREITRPVREVNDARNAEWMARFCESKLSLEKFAAALAEENEKLVADKGNSRGDSNALWLATRADATLAERGPWGSTKAETIKRHVRNMKKKGVLGEQHFRFVPFSLMQNRPRNMKMKDVLVGPRNVKMKDVLVIQNKPAANQMAKATPRKKKSPDIR
jgi:hypothetical protein